MILVFMWSVGLLQAASGFVGDDDKCEVLFPTSVPHVAASM